MEDWCDALVKEIVASGGSYSCPIRVQLVVDEGTDTVVVEAF